MKCKSKSSGKKWDGPYFEDYQMYPDFEAFRMSKLYNFFCNDTVWGVCILDREPIGIVTRHWEDETSMARNRDCYLSAKVLEWGLRDKSTQTLDGSYFSN